MHLMYLSTVSLNVLIPTYHKQTRCWHSNMCIYIHVLLYVYIHVSIYGHVVQMHWNGNVFILMKFSSLAALKVVKMTTSSAASDENFVKMTTFPFQCVCPGFSSISNRYHWKSPLRSRFEVFLSSESIWRTNFYSIFIIYIKSCW